MYRLHSWVKEKQRAIWMCHPHNGLVLVMSRSLITRNIQNSFYADYYQTWLVLQFLNIVSCAAQTIEEALGILTRNLISHRFSDEEGRGLNPVRGGIIELEPQGNENNNASVIVWPIRVLYLVMTSVEEFGIDGGRITK